LKKFQSTGTQQSLKQSLADKLKEARSTSVADFGNIAHRLEFVDEIDGVEYINDSKATDLGASEFSIEFMKKPILWILSESEYKENYKEQEKLVSYKVVAVIAYGRNTKQLVEAYAGISDYFFDARHFEEAVKIANCVARPGESVLFSPAAPSYPDFEDFKERGKAFREAVAALYSPEGRYQSDQYKRFHK